MPLSHLVLEGVLLLMLVVLLFSKRRPKRVPAEKLSKKEEDDLIKEWEPEPLISSKKTVDHIVGEPIVAEGIVGPHVTVNGKDKLNFASYNFLGLAGHQKLQTAATDAVRRYGVGSCGPRGFYGTIDCHLDLEQQLAKFLDSEEAILYSYEFSTIASIIPAYSKRGDVIFYDEHVSLAVQKGMLASRSKLVMFRHNDMAHLTQLLEEQAAVDRKDEKKAMNTRRFVVVEGLYTNTGDVCPLKDIVNLKYKYKLRIILDETMSFGVLGKTGRGVTEHFGVSIKDVDMLSSSMGGSLASVGGFCVGTSFVIDHQRLSSQGYCFSASLPPLNATTASAALEVMQSSEGVARLATLRDNALLLHSELKGIKGLTLSGEDFSPIKHLAIKDAKNQSALQQLETLQALVETCLDKDVLITKASAIRDEELHALAPSVRLTTCATHTPAEIKKAAAAIKAAAEKLFK